MFKAIVDGARKVKRAVTGGEPEELTPAARAFGEKIAQAFIAGRFADVHAMGTHAMQSRKPRDAFAASWRDAVVDHLPFTGFEISNPGPIDMGFIPGLEDVPQDQFAGFLEIVFSSPDIAFDSPAAFLVGIVLLDDRGSLRIGAIHAQ